MRIPLASVNTFVFFLFSSSDGRGKRGWRCPSEELFLCAHLQMKMDETFSDLVKAEKGRLRYLHPLHAVG
jgi:hypothetical protein